MVEKGYHWSKVIEEDSRYLGSALADENQNSFIAGLSRGETVEEQNHISLIHIFDSGSI